MTMPQYHDFSGFAINLYVLGMVTVDCKMPAIWQYLSCRFSCSLLISMTIKDKMNDKIANPLLALSHHDRLDSNKALLVFVSYISHKILS